MKKLSLVLVAAMLCATAAHAGTKVRMPVEAMKAEASKYDAVEGDDRVEAITEIEKYLTTIGSIVSDFSQSSTDGSTGTGKFFLKRPGKMRWQYNPPNPILLVSDGKVITYYDAGLDQVTYVGVDDTLAGFLAKREIKLESDSIGLTRLEEGDGTLRATIIQKKKPADGSLTLVFVQKPLALTQMIAKDAAGTVTTVKLEKPQYGPVLADKLFTFEDPRGVNHRRNRR